MTSLLTLPLRQLAEERLQPNFNTQLRPLWERDLAEGRLDYLSDEERDELRECLEQPIQPSEIIRIPVDR